MTIDKSEQSRKDWDMSFQKSWSIYTADMVLQKSGDDGYFVHKCRDGALNKNDLISIDILVGLKLAGLKIVIVDWKGKILETH